MCKESCVHSLRLVNSVLKLPDRQMNCFGEFELQNKYDQSCSSRIAFGLVEMTFGLVHAIYSLPNKASCKTNFFCALINQVLVKYLGTCSSFNLMDFIGLCWLGLLFTIIRKAVHANWNIAIPPWSQIIIISSVWWCAGLVVYKEVDWSVGAGLSLNLQALYLDKAMFSYTWIPVPLHQNERDADTYFGV